MLHRRLLAAAVLSLALASADAAAQGFAPFVVKDIRVEGLQRTEPGTVRCRPSTRMSFTTNGAKPCAAASADARARLRTAAASNLL